MRHQLCVLLLALLCALGQSQCQKGTYVYVDAGTGGAQDSCVCGEAHASNRPRSRVIARDGSETSPFRHVDPIQCHPPRRNGGQGGRGADTPATRRRQRHGRHLHDPARRCVNIVSACVCMRRPRAWPRPGAEETQHNPYVAIPGCPLFASFSRPQTQTTTQLQAAPCRCRSM